MFSKIGLPLLLIVFLGGCVSQGTYNKEVQQADVLSAQNKTYQALNAELQSEVQADQVRIKQLEGRLTVTLIDEIVFNSGSAEMNAKGRSTLEKIIGTLQSVTDKRIVVQGFTDNEPIGPALRARYPSNWELFDRPRQRRGSLSAGQGHRPETPGGIRLWRVSAGRAEHDRRWPSGKPPHRDRSDGHEVLK